MVWELTRRCAISRCVKKRSTKLGNPFSFLMRDPPSEFQAARGEPHQFRVNGKVPVGVCHLAMSQKRRQHRQTPLDVLVGSIPLNQRMDSESMSKIVKPRALVIFRLAQADLLRQVVETFDAC